MKDKTTCTCCNQVISSNNSAPDRGRGVEKRLFSTGKDLFKPKGYSEVQITGGADNTNNIPTKDAEYDYLSWEDMDSLDENYWMALKKKLMDKTSDKKYLVQKGLWK